jgi:hypothetical protein
MWANFAEFDMWHRAEEAAHTIEFRASTVWYGGALWTHQHLFVCSCQVTGSNQKYANHSECIGPCCRLLNIKSPRLTVQQTI